MLVLLVLLTASYFAVVLWVLRSKRRAAEAAVAAAPCLPEDDQAPASAIGWPPEGTKLMPYVDEGFAALDAYLAGATPPEIS